MVEVLRSHGGGWIARDEIAREIARRDLFRRPSDGRHPPSDQLRLRARKPEYRQLFECSDNACTRIRLRRGAGSAVDAELGEPPQGRSGATAWYDELRERYRPERLRVLLVAESPPDPGAAERRFFYSPVLRADNLYRGVAQALYDEREDVDVLDKRAVLERLKSEGFWLIDAVDEPVNRLGSAARTRAIADGVPRLVDRCIELAPELGVIVCHAKVYAAAAPSLRHAGVRVLHDEPLPFPLGNWRAQFVAGFRKALSGLS